MSARLVVRKGVLMRTGNTKSHHPAGGIVFESGTTYPLGDSKLATKRIFQRLYQVSTARHTILRLQQKELKQQRLLQLLILLPATVPLTSIPLHAIIPQV